MSQTSKDLVVVRIDGGICSQINFVALGLAIGSMPKCRLKVKYDLTWFREDGKDCNGRFVRNWDFPKASPGLPVEEASAAEIAAAKRHRRIDLSEISSIEDISCTSYLEGYPKGCFSLPGCRQLLAEQFRPALDAPSAAVAEEISRAPSCAVHVRRGDLSVFSIAYGQPCSNEYFAKAIRIVLALEPKARFYFFSDEPDYVRDVLLPSLPSDLDGRIVADNGSDKGYMDLALIAKCKHVIASIGSLGVYGSFLGGGTLITPKYRPECFQGMDNVIYLNEDRSLISCRQRQEDKRKIFPGVVKIRCGRKRSLLLFDRIRITYR